MPKGRLTRSFVMLSTTILVVAALMPLVSAADQQSAKKGGDCDFWLARYNDAATDRFTSASVWACKDQSTHSMYAQVYELDGSPSCSETRNNFASCTLVHNQSTSGMAHFHRDNTNSNQNFAGDTDWLSDD